MNTTTSAAAAPADLEDFVLPTDLGEIEYVVKHPITGLPTSGRIKLAGPTHPIRKAATFARMRSMLADGSADKVELETADEDETAFIALCTLGWSRIAGPGGTPLTFEIGAPHRLYSDPKYRWLRDQARDALRQRELFIEACATV